MAPTALERVEVVVVETTPDDFDEMTAAVATYCALVGAPLHADERRAAGSHLREARFDR